MSHHDHFENERYRVERVLQVLEDAAARLEARASVPLTLLDDVVAFLRATEEAAYEATEDADGDLPLSACVEQHIAARAPVNGMQDAVRSMRDGDTTAARRFAEFARNYSRLRREHMRADDRLFAGAANPPKAPGTRVSEENPESPATQLLYERVVASSTALREARV